MIDACCCFVLASPEIALPGTRKYTLVYANYALTNLNVSSFAPIIIYTRVCYPTKEYMNRTPCSLALIIICT